MSTQPDEDPSATPRVALSLELRQAREQAGLTQQDVVTALDWSPSKVNRIEQGTVKISVTDLRAALDLYKVTTPTRVEALVELARQSKESAWWDKYRKIADPAFIDFVALESSATLIQQYQSMVVPGLLQTTEYARRVITIADQVAETEQFINLRRERQKNTLRPGRRRREFVIDEAVLRRRVLDTEATLRQFERFKEVNRTSGVSIRVLRFTAGPHRGLFNSFQILGITSRGSTTYRVSLPSANAEHLIKNEVTIAKYQSIFTEILALASPASQLDNILDEVAESFA